MLDRCTYSDVYSTYNALTADLEITQRAKITPTDVNLELLESPTVSSK